MALWCLTGWAAFMKTMAAVAVSAMLLSFRHAQTFALATNRISGSQILYMTGHTIMVWDGQTFTRATNRTTTPQILYMTSDTNLALISRAVEIASGLRLGMTQSDALNYLEQHRIIKGTTNFESMSLFPSGRSWTTFCPLGNAGTLALHVRRNQAIAEPFLKGNEFLEGASIQSVSIDIPITFTNAP